MSNCYIIAKPDWEWQEIIAGFTTKRQLIKWTIKHRPKTDLKMRHRLCFYRTRGEKVVNITKDIRKMVLAFWQRELDNKRIANREPG